MTNMEMRAAMITRAKEKLRWDKANFGDIKYIAVADNDQAGAIGACECDKCTAARKRDGGTGLTYGGGQSGLSLLVANDLAASLAAEFPETLVSMQSYQDKLDPPTVTRPHPNVRIQFTTMGQNFARPLRSGGNLEANMTRDQFIEWTTIAPGQVTLWDYGCNFVYPLLLLPNWLKLGDDVAFYSERNVTGILMEACDGFQPPDLHEMRVWMLSQLYWDANANATELMLDFLDGYYGPQATPHLLTHMRLYTDAVTRTKHHVSVGDSVHAPFFAPSVVMPSLAQLAAAIAASNATPGNRIVVQRLEKLRLSPWYVMLFRWDEACMETKMLGMPWPLEHRQLNESYQAFVVQATTMLGSTMSDPNIMAGLAALSTNFTHTCL
jgi:hypothetical protein